MMIDAHTLLLLRAIGTGLLAAIAFVGFFLFFFAGENGTGRLFGIVMLFISMWATMMTTTSVAVIQGNVTSPEALAYYFSFWARETIAVWMANVAIIVLGIYLLRQK